MIANVITSRKSQSVKNAATTVTTDNRAATTYQPGTFTVAPLDLINDTTLSPHARLLWVMLRSYIYDPAKPYCWPSKATLAARLGVSERRVYVYLRELEEHEAISITTRTAEGRTNVYHLHPRPARGGHVGNDHPPMSKMTDEVDQREEDQEEEKDTQKGANAPLCVTYPFTQSKHSTLKDETALQDKSETDTLTANPESSAEARDSQDVSQVVYVARSNRQTRGRSAWRRGHTAAPAAPNQQDSSIQNVLLTESEVREAASNRKVTAPAARPTMLERQQPAKMLETSQHTHAATAAPLTPSEHVQDAIQTEIARQLAEYGVWPKRAAQLAAHAHAAGRTPDDIRAMHQQTAKANDPAALLATMIANNAEPPKLQTSEAERWKQKYTTGIYAHIFNRPTSTIRDETDAPPASSLAD